MNPIDDSGKNEMESSTPCIFGRFSFGLSPADISLPKKGEFFFNFGEYLHVYKLGKSNNIYAYQDGKRAFLIFGQIYKPVMLHPFVSEKQNALYQIATTKLNEIQGSFTIISISQEDTGPILSLTSDKFGFRRILYCVENGVLFFATHLSGLKLLLGNKSNSVSEEALIHYYNFSITPNDRTILNGIFKVPPGCTLTVENGRVKVEPYFSMSGLYHPEEFRSLPEDEICQLLDERLLQSINKRVKGESLAGVALSGGVDSGYIAQKLVQTGTKVIGYNLSYGNYYNEFDRIDFLSKALGIEVRKIKISPEDVLDNYEYANSISSEPMSFNNATMRFVAQAAQKDGIKLLFDGDGADRLFLGMNRYLEFQKAIRLFELLRTFGLAGLAALALKLVPRNEYKKLSFHFSNWSRGRPPYPERDLGGTTSFNELYEQRVYDLAVRSIRERFDNDFGVGNDFGLYFTYQAIQMCPEMFFYDPVDIQSQMGICPMPAFWDDDLVSLAISLPTEMKLRAGLTKYILRKAASLNLDPDYWMLPKIGLQSSFQYAIESEPGKNWLNKQREAIMDSIEYQFLKKVVPGGQPDPVKLVGLQVWKKNIGMAE